MGSFPWVEFLFGVSSGMVTCWNALIIVLAAVAVWYNRQGANSDADSEDS